MHLIIKETTKITYVDDMLLNQPIDGRKEVFSKQT